MATNKRNQTIRGLSVDKNKVRPRLTPEIRATMTAAEKKEYNKQRLVEYRNEYNKLYQEAYGSGVNKRIREEQEAALRFYREYQATQTLIEVSK